VEKAQQFIVESCLGTSCHLLGAEDLLAVIQHLPQEIKNKIDLQAVTCLQHCGKGPNIRINGEIMMNMTPERLLQVIQQNIAQIESCSKEE